MMYAAIIACEVGFWVVLTAGLVARYGLGKPRLGTVLLVCVPLVDLALLAFTVVDLRRGGEPSAAHGLAALYLGFCVAFGHRMIGSVDAWMAHRYAAAPKPPKAPAWGSQERVRAERETFGRAVLAGVVAVAVLLLAIWTVGTQGDASALKAWIPATASTMLGWLALGPGLSTLLAWLRPRDANQV